MVPMYKFWAYELYGVTLILMCYFIFYKYILVHPPLFRYFFTFSFISSSQHLILFLRGMDIYLFLYCETPIKMKSWNILFMDRLKRSLVRQLDGELENGESIRKFQRLRTITSIVTEELECQWDEVKNDNDVCVMMHRSNLTPVIS